MAWNHHCIKIGKAIIHHDRCPWCGETWKDQLAFENFYLNVLFPEEDDGITYPKQRPPKDEPS